MVRTYSSIGHNEFVLIMGKRRWGGASEGGLGFFFLVKRYFLVLFFGVLVRFTGNFKFWVLKKN
jgi:hypothetical protein